MALIVRRSPDNRPPAGSSQKSLGGNGAYINGRWHPHGAEAAKTGTEPPHEHTLPATPYMEAALKKPVDDDPVLDLAIPSPPATLPPPIPAPPKAAK